MRLLELDFWVRHVRWVGVAAIAVSALTWWAELAGAVYVCPYCRTQRTVIGALGLLMLLPRSGSWIGRYLASVLAAYGFSVGATQHFAGWRRIMSDKFEWGAAWYLNPWLLSGIALFMIMGLLLLIWACEPRHPRPASALA